MKKSTKVLLCLSAVFLSAGVLLMVWGIAAGVHPLKVFRDGFMNISLYEHRTSPFSPDGRYTIPAGGIQKLDIDWVDGQVTIEPYDGGDILVEETSSSTLDEHTALMYTVKHGTLEIDVSPERAGIFFTPSTYASKDLHIRFPRSLMWESVDLSAVNAHLDLQATTAEKVSVDVVNGDVSLQRMVVENLTLNSVKGSLDVQASQITTVDMDTVDGRLTGEFTACPTAIHFNSVTGDAKLTLPADSQFAVQMDSLTGNLDSAFSGTYQDGRYTVGNGAAQFTMDTIKGTVQIQKAPTSGAR